MCDYAENTEVIGSYCSLASPYRGYSDGIVVCDYGTQLVVRLTNGKEIEVYRDEVIIYD
ncbi:hypothetical protein [Bacteroides timonensis]|uniref:hypothetical protein n=1 Tax=Bacteroides timonensis TaxID=1470345 RepID=UPI0004AE9718|nr:hypothetical protein [Bacteroides timonensis]